MHKWLRSVTAVWVLLPCPSNSGSVTRADALEEISKALRQNVNRFMLNTNQSKALPLQTASVRLTASPCMHRMHRMVIERLGCEKDALFFHRVNVCAHWGKHSVFSSKYSEEARTLKTTKTHQKGIFSISVALGKTSALIKANLWCWVELNTVLFQIRILNLFFSVWM